MSAAGVVIPLLRCGRAHLGTAKELIDLLSKIVVDEEAEAAESVVRAELARQDTGIPLAAAAAEDVDLVTKLTRKRGAWAGFAKIEPPPPPVIPFIIHEYVPSTTVGSTGSFTVTASWLRASVSFVSFKTTPLRSL